MCVSHCNSKKKKVHWSPVIEAMCSFALSLSLVFPHLFVWHPPKIVSLVLSCLQLLVCSLFGVSSFLHLVLLHRPGRALVTVLLVVVVVFGFSFSVLYCCPSLCLFTLAFFLLFFHCRLLVAIANRYDSLFSLSYAELAHKITMEGKIEHQKTLASMRQRHKTVCGNSKDYYCNYSSSGF